MIQKKRRKKLWIRRRTEWLRWCIDVQCSRVHNGKRNVTVWRPSVCLFVPSTYLPWLTKGQHATRPTYTPNLIAAILSAINSLSLNYPVSSRSRTLLLELSWKLPSHVISLLSYAFFTGSGSLSASNTSSFHLPTRFSQLTNLHTFITSSLFNALAVLALHPSLLLLGQLHRHL